MCSISVVSEIKLLKSILMKISCPHTDTVMFPLFLFDELVITLRILLPTFRRKRFKTLK